ncbi:hypothetical protein Cgig2_024269 [Carnegiea gigantea]|uniref:Cysteine-rich PDZ-binding protein n=1 Tax=Carnegiea gigantea TaxID=171969 RepID=A0A9Q1JW20_9CARY|nr:hypothetical protein Cgig2_024269 [Carnegiea gigantea]
MSTRINNSAPFPFLNLLIFYTWFPDYSPELQQREREGERRARRRFVQQQWSARSEKKLAKVIVPDKWKEGASNTNESGGRKINENKLLSKKHSFLVILPPIYPSAKGEGRTDGLLMGMLNASSANSKFTKMPNIATHVHIVKVYVQCVVNKCSIRSFTSKATCKSDVLFQALHDHSDESGNRII